MTRVIFNHTMVTVLLALAFAATAAEPSPPEAGVVPIAPLSGDFWTRPVLTGG